MSSLTYVMLLSVNMVVTSLSGPENWTLAVTRPGLLVQFMGIPTLKMYVRTIEVLPSTDSFRFHLATVR